MIIVTGNVRTTPATHQAMVDAGIAHSSRSRAEPGCIAHNVHVDAEDPHRIVFVELWADADALRAHFNVPEARAFAAYMRERAETPPTLNIYEAETIR